MSSLLTNTGVRLDSGDLAYLSVKTREAFQKAAKQFDIPKLEHLKVIKNCDIYNFRYAPVAI